MKLQYPAMCLVFFLTGLNCAPAQDHPPTAEIIRRVVESDEASTKALQKLEYDQAVLVEKLDDDGKVKGSNTINMVVRPGAASAYTVVSKNGDGTFIPNESDPKTAKQARDSEKTKTAFSLRQLAGRYVVEYERADTFQGHPAWVLRFSPKPNQSYKDRMEKVLNRLRGKIWVSTGDYSILQTKATLTEPVEVAWFVATMQKLTFDYVGTPIPGGYGPDHINISFVIEAPFKTVRQRQTITMKNFRPRGAVVPSPRPR